MTRRRSPEALQRAGKLIGRVFLITVIMYGLLGMLLVYQAYAQQTLSSVYPVRGKVLPMSVPTGSNDQTVKAYYDYLTLRHVGTLNETYHIDWYYFGTMYLVIGTGLIVFYFLTFAWYARSRRQGDLYPVEVYNAYITERGGPVDSFNWAVYAILLIYMLYYTVINLILGQYY
jgi:hypothetical protein